MFFDRFTEDARRAVAIAKEEAASIGSPHVEAEHLLLGIARAIQPDLRGLLSLQEVEDTLRTDLRGNARFESRETPTDPPLSNPGKRILAFAAEEAVRLNSPGIGSGHLLLGVLRESESVASRLLTAHNVDLPLARQIVAQASPKGGAAEESASSIGLHSRIKRRYWIGIAGQLALMTLLGLAVVNSKVAGRTLLVIAGIWFLAALGWVKLGPSGFRSLGKQNSAKIAVIYALGWLYQLFMFGWLLPFSVGIYRAAVR